mmetsp:Transcript_19111/g.16935  ORF Transcript_19111/g.16935 Transcript_19111/m.16935 type:complete len:126 (+) Transcript_19111:469-846(+)
MLNFVENYVDDMITDGEADLASYMNILTFSTISGMLLGRDCDTTSTSKIPYTKSDGSIENQNLLSMLMVMTKDLVENFFHPLTSILPILSKYDLVNPFRRFATNLVLFKTEIKRIMVECKDEDSI